MFNSALTAARKVAIINVVDSGNGDLIDVHAMADMRAAGYISAATIKTGIKGRPPLAFSVTGKGRSFMALVALNKLKKAALKFN